MHDPPFGLKTSVISRNLDGLGLVSGDLRTV
jgi:hypothetical protein